MLTEADLAHLRRARRMLEHPSWTIKLLNQVGRPVAWTLNKLPGGLGKIVTRTTQSVLDGALGAAIRTLSDTSTAPPRNGLHKAVVATTGAAAGAFGLPMLALELPVSTVVMLRSIADNARAQGEDLSDIEARLHCVMVFGLGGPGSGDDAAETGYFAVRTALARAVSEAAAFVAERGATHAIAERTAPALLRFISPIAQRFSPAVAEKIAAQAAPVLGALGGLAINVAFINHYQDVAWGHFTVRRLERAYGVEAVRAAYDRLR